MAARSQGCRLWWSTDAFVADATQVAGVTAVEVPKVTKNRIETTDLDDTTKTYLAGLIDLSSASFPINFDGEDATHQALLVLEASSGIVSWKVEMQDESGATVTSAEFLAYIDSFSPSASVDGKQEATLTLQPTAGNTYTHADTAET